MPVVLKLDEAPFTIHNLPYGVFSTAEEPQPRTAVAIGQHAIDLTKYAKSGTLKRIQEENGIDLVQIFSQPTLNMFAELPWDVRKEVRGQLQNDLQAQKVPTEVLVRLGDAVLHLPMQTRGFSDFYTSLDHCKNCSGELTSKNIYKNWFHAPSVYNSRVSSVVPTPAEIHRPNNVGWSNGTDSDPVYGPSKKLDFELEMGFYVSKPVPFGETLAIDNVKEHIFGFILLNDWSARDHQLFEMRPLGPFHSKGFGTSVSNWIVPLEALIPFGTTPHLVQDPPPFPHLTWPGQNDGALDVKLRVKLVRDGEERVLSTSNLKYLYWTPYQQLVHHAASGCGMQTGDLIGTGTISGSGRNEQGVMTELGCLYEAERTKTNTMPPKVTSSAYKEGYLEDGDEIILEGWCENGEGNVTLGFGECRGKILPPK
ncbi:Fumarylacetoacetase [Cercospora zeina]